MFISVVFRDVLFDGVLCWVVIQSVLWTRVDIDVGVIKSVQPVVVVLVVFREVVR